MNFRFQPTKATDHVLNASLTIYRGDDWKVVGIFSLLPAEYDALAKMLADSGIEVVTNDSAEPIPAHVAEGS